MTQNQKLMTRIRAKGKLDRIKLRKARNYLFVAPAVIFIVLLMIYPLLYNFYISVRDVNVGTLLSGNAPFVGLRNYKTMIGDPTFWHSLLISFIFTGGSLLFQFTIGFALALFFQRPFPGGGIMRAFLLLGWLMPIVVSASIWKWLRASEAADKTNLARGGAPPGGSPSPPPTQKQPLGGEKPQKYGRFKLL